MGLKIRVLGAAAGGGFPQWNCNCRQCLAQRSHDSSLIARTQSSIAVSGDGKAFVLINASPDIRAQILSNPQLQPCRSIRDTAIAGIVVIDAQIDHVTGLLLLRESPQPLHLYCTSRVHADLNDRFPIIPLLNHYCGVVWHEIPIDGQRFSVDGVDGINFSAVPLQSNAPPYSPNRGHPHPGDNIGLLIGDCASGAQAFYAPGLGQADAAVKAAMQAADVIMVDGTCWTDDELPQTGVGSKSARSMGHLPQSGPGGMKELLSAYGDKRRILIHINNTNPILDAKGPECAELKNLGIEVAYDSQLIEV